MEVKIEIQEITLDMSVIWDVKSYPNNGFYRVNNSEMVLIHNGCVMAMLFYSDWASSIKIITGDEDKPEEDSKGLISEEFALRLLDITQNKETYKDAK